MNNISDGDSALNGVTVVEWTGSIPGAFCAKLMADLGARVIKVEKPNVGDETRGIGPFLNDIPDPETSAPFLYFNTNKRSITLDVRTPTGKKLLTELVSKADILVEDNPPGTPEEIGLDYATLSELNKRLIMTSITPFGQTGPHRNYKAYDLNIFHSGGEGYVTPAGLLNWNLFPDREPIKLGGHVGSADIGLGAAIATLGALYWCYMTGQGQHIDVSGQEVLANLMRYQSCRYNEGWIENRATLLLPVAGLTQCKDGFVLIIPLEKRMWDGLIELMGNPEWAKEERFQFDYLIGAYGREEQADVEARQKVHSLIEEWMLEHTKEEIVKRGQEKSCAIGAVCTIEDLFNSKQLQERDFFIEIAHPRAGKIKYPSAPYKSTVIPTSARKPSPLLGEHNEEIICGMLGYSKDELTQMRRTGII